ncbi:MAG TPA: galactokinase [Candidatus Coproplasma avicola]|uniref:Galactokinase n=1 Tax=Candidatus Coproplasma avicola TaxID=2840744 RepID=A0A9D1E626_9FIRM|nr:galactokinase [Candidatus Coproplasma avicola]
MINQSEYKFKVSASGRVNIIGEHIDYCGGKVMPAALSLKNTVYVRPNGTNFINLSWTTLPDTVSLDISRLDSYKHLRYGNYQAGSAYLWQKAGHKIVGCDMVQDCTVPFGSGLSSSAAIEVSTIAALATVAGEGFDNVEVALTAQAAERQYAGVNCGIMDQYASACGKKGMAMLLDCKTLQCDYLPLDLGGYAMVITDCKKPHNLVESKYNERRQQTEQALAILKEKLDITCLADVSPEDFQKYSHLLPGVIKNRTEHVVYECERVKRAAEALRNGDILTLGALLNESHASLKNLYETTGFEPDVLAETAQAHPACIGSRLTGGGFGGCTISLVKKECVQQFEDYLLKQYRQKTGYTAVCYRADIDDGITVERI